MQLVQVEYSLLRLSIENMQFDSNLTVRKFLTCQKNLFDPRQLQ